MKAALSVPEHRLSFYFVYDFLCCVISQNGVSSRDLLLSVSNRKALAPVPSVPPFKTLITLLSVTQGGSSIGSEFAWHASDPEFDPHVRHILSWRLGHENISTAILPLALIQEEQFQLLAKECALSTGKLPRRLAQEQCG